MSTVIVETVAPANIDQEPGPAHWVLLGSNPLRALCGTRLIGETAPPDHPLCAECKRLRGDA